MANKNSTKTSDQLTHENEELRSRLTKTEKTLNALLKGKIKIEQLTTESKIKDNKSHATNKDSTKSREALKISEDTHSSILNAMSDGLAIHEVVYNSSGKAIDYIITDVNPAFEKITRLKKKSISGRKATEVYSVNEAPYLEIYAQVAASCSTVSFETYFPPMNKHFHVSVFSQEKGKFATVFQDISEQKRAEEDLRVTIQRFYRILSNLHNGILLVTNENIIEFSNQSFCDMFGLKESPTELLNLSADDLISKIRNSYKDPDAAIARIEEIVKLGESVTAEDVEMNSDKTVLRDFIPINVGGEVTGRLWNHTDITERKLISDTQSFLLSHNYKSTGVGFFESLASFLASILHMDYVCIDKLEGDKLTATTVAIFNYGKFDPNITYTLKETPCGDVVGKTICCFPRNVSNLFPNDPALKELNAESYIGTTLWSFDGKPIGLIAVIGRNPLKNQHLAEVILKLVAVRAAGELERKNAEEAIIESEERFRTIAETAPVLVCITRIEDSIVLFTNEVNNKAFGFRGEEIIGTKGPDYYYDPEDRKRMIGLLKEQGVVNNWPLKVKKSDGTTFWIMTSVRPITYNGQAAMIGASIDITEAKKIEEGLRESEAKFLSIFNLSPLPMALSTIEDGIYHEINESFIRDSGFTKEEIVGRTSSELKLFLLADTRERILEEIRNKGAIYALPCDFRLKNGKTLNCLLSSSSISIKGTLFLLSIIQDVTDILKTKMALTESEERFRALAENIPDMIVRFDRNLRFTYGNPAVFKRTGLPFEFLLGKTPMEYGNASVSAQNWDRVAREVLNSGEPRRMVVKNEWQGVSQVYDALLVPERNNSGQVSSIISIARDITEMKRAENTLRESEQKLKYHFENSPLAFVEWDKDFRILQWSAEAERIFGLRKKDVLGVRIDLLNIIYDEDLPVVQKTIARLISGKELKVISQNRNYTKTGEIIECIWYNSVLLDENGEMSSVMSLIEDVTILKRTENQLLESRESYKELVTNARSIIIKLDNEGKFTFINEFATNFFGYRKEELLGKSVIKTIVPEKESTGRDLDKLVENIIEDPDKYSVNINENIKKSGEKAWVEWHNKALYDRSGNRTGHLAIGVDITKRKKAEEALKESEVKLWSVLNATQESIYMFDRVGTIVMSNSTGISRLKKTTENEIIGHQFPEFMTPEIAGPRMEILDEVFTKGKPQESEDERDCRIYHHNFFPVFKDDQVLFVVSYSSDITDRKRTESKLHESEDRFRTIAESLTVMISITRICDSTLTFINEPYVSTFGYKKAELIEKKVPDIFYFSQDYTSVNDILKIKGIVDNMEIKVKKRDGSPFWIMTSIRTINFMGEPSYLSASFDITETKKAQEELLRLNRTLNAHSKSSQAMIHSTNEFNYLNAVCKIIIEDCGHSMVWVGYAEKDKRRSVKPVAFFGFDKGYIDQLNITWDDSDRGRGPTGTAIRTGKPSMCKNMLTDPEFKPWRKAALERGYASSLVLPLMSEGNPFGAISIYSKEPDSFSEPEINLLSDLADDLAYGISFLRLTEAERASARAVKKSEVKLKEMVVTKDKFFNIVAHDLKNPFTSLLGSSELLYDNINQMSSENIRKLALILNDSAKGGYAILQNLLDWSRSQTGLINFNPENINLKIVIDENIDNLQLQVTNKGISLKSELIEDLFILADKNMINTVLRNLLSNAVKYTFKKGTIVVTVTKKTEEIIITVKDSGIGISDDKAFVLFKIENSLSLPGTEKEQGTGLGLKLCKEFTERMGGRIWVESTLGKGSKFKFTIPIKA